MKKWKELCPPISTTTRNLFLELAENIAQSLKNHFLLCMWGTNMGDQWPWEAREPPAVTGVWLLKTSIIGKNCLAQWGRQFNTSVGSLTFLGQRFYNVTTWKT
jgi:hypothetical protein